jgi:hypothetical protein
VLQGGLNRIERRAKIAVGAYKEYRMEVSTRRCSTCHHPEILIKCDDSIPNPDVEWLIEVLEGAVLSGTKHKDGELIQIGWMFVLLSAIDAGTLLLREPDLREFPIQWTDGVTTTLRHLRLQKDTAESLGFASTMQFPTIRESALIGVDVESNMDEFVLSRVAATGTDSGWFVGRREESLDYNDPRNVRRVSLYEAALLLPAIVMFLCLPFGSEVKVSRSTVTVWLNGDFVAPSPNSFLDRWLAQET